MFLPLIGVLKSEVLKILAFSKFRTNLRKAYLCLESIVPEAGAFTRRAMHLSTASTIFYRKKFNVSRTFGQPNKNEFRRVKISN